MPNPRKLSEELLHLSQVIRSNAAQYDPELLALALGGLAARAQQMEHLFGDVAVQRARRQAAKFEMLTQLKEQLPALSTLLGKEHLGIVSQTIDSNLLTLLEQMDREEAALNAARERTADT